MLVKALRNGLGQIIIFLDWISRPAKMQRDPAVQAQIEEQLKALSLYQFKACPFCVKVRRALHRLNLPVVLRDARNDADARQALEEQGGKIQVPCLRIEEQGKVTWLYESKAIIDYLEDKYADKN